MGWGGVRMVLQWIYFVTIWSVGSKIIIILKNNVLLSIDYCVLTNLINPESIITLTIIALSRTL